jgi:hypothetical protein
MSTITHYILNRYGTGTVPTGSEDFGQPFLWKPLITEANILRTPENIPELAWGIFASMNF